MINLIKFSKRKKLITIMDLFLDVIKLIILLGELGVKSLKVLNFINESVHLIELDLYFRIKKKRLEVLYFFNPIA